MNEALKQIEKVNESLLKKYISYDTGRRALNHARMY